MMLVIEFCSTTAGPASAFAGDKRGFLYEHPVQKLQLINVLKLATLDVWLTGILFSDNLTD